MSRLAAKKIVRKYAQKLKGGGLGVSSVYLFGSHARGRARADSDIDVAIISPKFRDRFGRNYLKLWQIRREVDMRIEPHGFTKEDFQNLADPMVYEIKATGIKII